MADKDYQKLELPYRSVHDCNPAPTPFVVIGAGPVGMTLALDLAYHGHRVILIDDDNKLSTGSRAICFSKRALDIWDRLGVGQRMVDKGVSWNIGRVFFHDEEVWRFDLLPEPDHRRPAFINLQQYYCEGYLYDAIQDNERIDVRWRHKALAVDQTNDGVILEVDTPDGTYSLHASWVIACDGARSPVRAMLGQESHGQVFQDRFLIADVHMAADFPSERWFWFDPPFHPDQSVLLHRQPDNIWRIDFQLGWDADPVHEAKPENVIPRVQALLGPEAEFSLEWVSIYTFCCERMDTFRHGRVLFAGDAAYRVSPFGARGANSGIQDADNLAWKLDLVTRGLAPVSLVDTYCEERAVAADENLQHSTRSTDFITPKSAISRLFRDMTLSLAKETPFARNLVNSGRLSTPTHYPDSSLTTPDTDEFEPTLPLGGDAPDGPIIHGRMHEAAQAQWWLAQLQGRFSLTIFCLEAPPTADQLQTWAALQDQLPLLQVVLVLAPDVYANTLPPGNLSAVADTKGLLTHRYDARDGTCYLIRPDHHIAARWREFDASRVRAALQRATKNSPTTDSCHG